ncbi:cytochrome-c oxidase, cbb3-type subunit III [Piscinibacter sakaiensis]|uniref:Cbb3-type cytochrome c oxidase subunit n=1 Tax=Piscinibacter sakaiensis TaxID=1547922 RepID=A0A0K8NUS7_PISS1|nr:cytochrome-c oxidase, cbb3-type subunit III [Piscinibacter sakaiensis]GAP33695.1 cytochrome c oxidase, subunit CcoP [Piscinibacter sakaiensis]
MSDFLSSGWSVYIAAVTLFGLVACLWLLLVASRRKVMANDNSTGHVWDEDLRELNNPLPRWWMVLFVITVVFALGYLVLYPGLGSHEGRLGWTSTGQYQAEQKQAEAEMSAVYARYTSLDAEALARDPKAMGIGERLFINNCAACHGSDARGSKGFPNLTDGDWLHGGSFDKIKETITKGRVGVMPPMAAAVGGSEEVKQVANYVLSLSGSPHNSLAAQLGRSKFTACAACHGAKGEGNQAVGAPNLSDKIWLHGWGEDAIVSIVTQGKTNVMPAQEGRLTPAQIHVLGAYVWSLSHPTMTAAR